MRSDSELYLPKLFGSKNANVRSTLSGPFVIDKDGPSIYFLDPAGGTRTVRLPWVEEGQAYTIVNVGQTGTLSVVDGDAVTIASLNVGSSGVFLSSDYKWYRMAGVGSSGGGGGTAAGPANSIQFNVGSEFAGDGNFTWISGSGLTDKNHAAIGNSAVIDSGTFAPGDPVNGFTYANYFAPLTISENRSGDLSGGSGCVGIVNYAGYKHTGAGQAYAYGTDSEPVINTDSTGPWGYVYGAFLSPFNYGSGNIAGMYGAFVGTQHRGSGAITDAWGIDAGVILNNATGSITTAYGVDAYVTSAGGGNISTAYGVRSTSPFLSSGGTITNTYGIYVEPTGGGTAKAYNIVSANAGYLGTMASTVGGNLFQGSIAVGNYADIGKSVMGAGDPANQSVLAKVKTPIVSNSFLSGDLGPNYQAGAAFMPTFKHTGTGYAYANGVEAYPWISSESTGPWGQLIGYYALAFNYGHGPVDSIYGGMFQAGHFGPGATCDHLFGFFGFPQCSVGPVTDVVGVGAAFSNYGSCTVTSYKALFAQAPSLSDGTAIVTSMRGLSIAPHTGGSSRSYNIVSEHPSYLGTMASTVGGNLFQGHVAIGTHADVNAFSALYADERRSADLSSSPSVYSFNSTLTQTGASGFPASLSSNTTLAAGSASTVTLSAGSFSMRNDSTNNATGQGIGVAAHNYAVTAAGKCFMTAVSANSYQYAASGTIDQTYGIAADVGAVMGGNVIKAVAVSAGISGYGGTITNGIGVEVEMQYANAGATLTALTGVSISDTSGKAATALNIASKGAASRNLFEGTIKLGTATNATPQDGDMWFDGSTLKIRIAGVTKTVTVA
jgi:hypothetical protein